MKKSLAWKLYLTGTALIVVALIIGAQTLSWPIHAQTTPVSVNLAPITTPEATTQPKIGGKPTRIVVPSRSVDLTIIDGSFNAATGDWTLSNTKAQFATNSSVANNKGGNTFIYGHDIPQVFKRLEGLTAGELAYIYGDTGYVFTYRFRAAIDVPPTDVSLFSYTGPSILTLQTCSGIWSETRHLMTFDFVEVQKI